MRKWFRKWGFQSKLLFIFLTMILTPVILLSFFEFYYSKKMLADKTNDYLKNLAAVTLSKIDSTVSDIENVAFYINGNNTIQAYLKAEKQVVGNRVAYYELHSDIRQILASYVLLRQEINAICIHSESGREYTYTKTRNGPSLDITRYIRDEKQYWAVDKNHIVLMKKLYAFPTQSLLGYIALDVNAKSLYDIIADIDLTKSGRIFLVNEEGRILATESETLSGELLDEPYRNFLGENEAFYNNVRVGNTYYSVYNSGAISNGWYMVLAIPRDYYMRDITKLKNVIIPITLTTAFLTALLSILVSRGITRPIRFLSGAMENFGQGNFDINCQVDSEDEIGRLSHTFNQMVMDMNSLVNTVYEQKVMKQEAQMKSLQMQINPHFLYNTLDTINWMARIRHVDEIGDMVAALSNMMRYSLEKKSFVRLGEEVKSLKDYIAIQNYRYQDKMVAEIEIDESLMSLYIPRLLIQPILENAIVHGIEEKLDKGHILVAARREDEDLYIQIMDDGVGMTEETMSHILREDYSMKKSGHTSIGVVNVNRRIQMIYGKDYGLLVQSVLGAGTKITIHIPAREEEQEEVKKDEKGPER
ncbi:sensor histidine kinase [Clostridium sp. WB02_MRS01]|uniref:sensor histidine kinase n=1 Tax=Clostridium sp. WB02_MRS01 TaxID=2605777 RepID=UPI0012B369C7|nr:sensor histidine kinase [Clostridium sp. WB02_MRS01]MSS09304.1 sensor histidine kinase [Clostridium sp. WB02_MRS01]